MGEGVSHPPLDSCLSTAAAAAAPSRRCLWINSLLRALRVRRRARRPLRAREGSGGTGPNDRYLMPNTRAGRLPRTPRRPSSSHSRAQDDSRSSRSHRPLSSSLPEIRLPRRRAARFVRRIYSVNPGGKSLHMKPTLCGNREWGIRGQTVRARGLRGRPRLHDWRASMNVPRRARRAPRRRRGLLSVQLALLPPSPRRRRPAWPRG